MSIPLDETTTSEEEEDQETEYTLPDGTKVQVTGGGRGGRADEHFVFFLVKKNNIIVEWCPHCYRYK